MRRASKHIIVIAPMNHERGPPYESAYYKESIYIK